MRIKKPIAAIVAVLALTATAASSASATVSTTAAEWYTGTAPGTTLAVGTTKTVTASTSVVITLHGMLLGAPVTLDATGLECISCVIKDEAVTEKTPPVAVGEGTIKFTGVTVTTPPGCVAESGTTPGTVETKLLEIHADWMDSTEPKNKHAFVQFFPKTGAVFASIRFTNKSATEICPLTGPYNVTGSIFGESTNDTGVQAATQDLKFNSTVQTTTGASLLFGASPATLSGSANAAAGGTLFGVH